MTFDKKLFAKLLKENRAAKMTREAFAEELGMNERSVARIESGERLTTLPTFFDICKILDISLEQLYCTYSKVQTKQESSSEFEQLIQKLCQMDSNEIGLVSDIIEAIEKRK